MTKDEDARRKPVVPELLGPDDTLTDAQAIRLYTVIGRLMGIRAALDAGMSVSELESQEWIVDVELLNPSGPLSPVVVGPLLKARDVAEMLSVPTTWVYAAARDGRLPCVHVGRHIRFKRHEIQAWIDNGGAGAL